MLIVESGENGLFEMTCLHWDRRSQWLGKRLFCPGPEKKMVAGPFFNRIITDDTGYEAAKNACDAEKDHARKRHMLQLPRSMQSKIDGIHDYRVTQIHGIGSPGNGIKGFVSQKAHHEIRFFPGND